MINKTKFNSVEDMIEYLKSGDFFEDTPLAVDLPEDPFSGADFDVKAKKAMPVKKPPSETSAPSDIPKDMRPRQRLIALGREALSGKELLSIILNTGVKGKNVSVLAMELLAKLHSNNGIPTIEELCKISGMGETKACVIIAMLEFGRRRWANRGVIVNTGSDVFNLLRHYADSRQEKFISMSLNGAHEVLETRVVTIGLVNKTIIHPREVFADILQDRASAVCIAHNHPSGNCLPSDADDDVTQTMEKAADLLGIQFLDHIIFTKDNYYSYNKNGRLYKPAALAKTKGHL
ncbi:MAG: DNA repair protein RadC [Termitinemataceae bacterium]|nr:MAG: DNA repair protein RadC [Termitinemataceae bacterium]